MTAEAKWAAPYSVQNELHWDENTLMQRFQEWAPKFQEGETTTKEIPLDSIDKVPVAMIAAANDETCPYKTA